MAFVSVEQWPIERRRISMIVPAANPWIDRILAALPSVAISAALLFALMMAGEYQTTIASNPARPLNTIDVTLASTLDQGAASQASAVATPAQAPTPPAPVAKPQPQEWSMMSLPPEPVATPAPPAPAAAPSPAAAAGTAGTGPGAGYDPYAFASVQRMPTVMPHAAASPATLDQAALAELQKDVAIGLGVRGRAIAMQVVVDQTGRIASAAAATDDARRLGEQVARLIVGAHIFAPDATRPEAMTTTIRLIV